MTPAQLQALERANAEGRGVSWYAWAANRLNSLFESHGTTDSAGRRPAADIRPDTIRDGERRQEAQHG